MNKMLAAIASLIIISVSMPAISQEKADRQKPGAEKKQAAETDAKDAAKLDPSKLWVDLSCLMYMEWGYFTGFKYTGSSTWNKLPRWGVNTGDYMQGWAYHSMITPEQPSNYSGKDNNTFQLNRAYVTVKKRLGEIFSAKITVDIDPKNSDFIYLKYGFIQLFKEFSTPVGPIGLKAQVGKIATPVIGITDNLSDLRWIGMNYINNSKMILNGKCFDDSADLGGLVSLSLLKLVTFEYMISNGEGVKSDHNETYAGKSHTLLVSINPVDYLKNLTVNFYGRWEDTNKNRIEENSAGYPIKYQGIDSRSYVGAGIAWSSDYLKLGMNFFAPEMQFSKTTFIYPYTGYSPRYRQKFMMIDSWFNFNLGALVRPVPILLIGRAAWGRELKSVLANGRQGHETLVLGGGIGYQFSDYFRMVLYYETVRYTVASKLHDVTKKNPTPNNNVYIKAEVKF